MSNETMIQGKTIWNNSRITDRPRGRITPQKIWELSRTDNDDEQQIARLELTDLIRFKGFWYCSFHEGAVHDGHPAGRCRLIRSQDGRQWEMAALFDWESADVRELKLSITPEGWLMGSTSLCFVSQEPRLATGAENPQELPRFYYQLESPETPSTDLEAQVARQSVTWLSQDGINWSSAYAPANGFNNWRWYTTWYNGMGYSISYVGPDNGTLYRTRDGKQWRALARDIFPGGRGNEAAIAFGNDGTGYVLLRDAMPRRNPDIPARGKLCPMLGIGTAPYYTEWEWKELMVDLGDDSGLLPVEEGLRSASHGPRLIRLSDGRLLAAACVKLPDDPDFHVTLFLLDPATATLKKFAVIDGRSYAGIVEHEGQVWVSCVSCVRPFKEICLAKVELPPEAGYQVES